MVPASNGRFEALQQNAVQWHNRLKQAAAVCNGLTMISKTLVVGDDMERKLFKGVEARFLVGQALLHVLVCCRVMHSLFGQSAVYCVDMCMERLIVSVCQVSVAQYA